MTVQRSAAIYYAVQGCAVLAWWALLIARPESREWFRMGKDPAVLLSFWMPDVLFLAVGSLLAAVLCWAAHRDRALAAWFATGLVTYPTFYCLAYALQTGEAWLSVVLMAPATIWSGVFAIGVSRFGAEMFRPSAAGSTGYIWSKTLAQIVVVWTLILGVIPWIIVWIEDRIGIPRLSFLGQWPLSVMLFVAVSTIGIWGAWVMSRKGRGTPLPMDHATELVIQGPYAYVRNPMAVSGIGQGLSVALLWGSSLVALYALMGSLIWQLIFRPLEEQDLERRFGEPYRAYCRQVRCWIPRFGPYRG